MQNPRRIELDAGIGHVGGRAAHHGLKGIKQVLRKALWRDGSAVAQGEQKICRVGCDKVVGSAAGPQAHALVLGKVAHDGAECGTDDLVTLLEHGFWADVGVAQHLVACLWRAQQGRVGHGPADELFCAAVGIDVELGEQRTQGKHGHGTHAGLALGFKRIQVALHVHLGGAAQGGDGFGAQARRRWPYGNGLGADDGLFGSVFSVFGIFKACGKAHRCFAKAVLGPHAEAERGLAVFVHGNSLRCGLLGKGQPLRGAFHAYAHACAGAAAFNGIGHNQRPVKLVAGGCGQRQQGLENKRAAHLHGGFCSARKGHALLGCGAAHGHDADFAAGILRHGKAHLCAVGIHRHDILPQGKGRFAPALERIEEAPAGAGHVAAETGYTATQTRMVGHEQVENLGRTHVQRPVAQQISQRVGGDEAGQLQHAFVHGKDQRPARHARGEPHGNGITRQSAGGSRKGKAHVTLVHARHKGGHGHNVRFHVDNVRIQRAGVGYVDVTASLEIFGNANFLHAFASLSRKPCLRQYVFALNGYEARARIGGGKAHLDGFAGGVLLLVEPDAQVALGKGFGRK